MSATCHLCGEKLDGRVCPTCGEGEGTCHFCGGQVSGGTCRRCGRRSPDAPMSDDDLHHVVGGMGVAGYIGVGLGIIRLIQGRAIRREMMRRN